MRAVVLYYQGGPTYGPLVGASLPDRNSGEGGGEMGGGWGNFQIGDKLFEMPRPAHNLASNGTPGVFLRGPGKNGSSSPLRAVQDTLLVMLLSFLAQNR